MEYILVNRDENYMADLISDSINAMTAVFNATCKSLGITSPIESIAGCQEQLFQKAVNEGSMGVQFNVDSQTAVNRNIMGPSLGSMVYDMGFRFNTDDNARIKRTPGLIPDYHNRTVDGVGFN